MWAHSWFRSLFTSARKIRKCPSKPRRQLHACLRLESLEDRCVPSTFTVLNTSDSGPGSLRQPVGCLGVRSLELSQVDFCLSARHLTPSWQHSVS